MKETELKKAYARCCATKGFEPNEAQFKTWKSTMGFFDAADIEKAIDLWYEQQTTFPMPAELKPIIARVKHDREAKASVKKWLVGWECDVCGHHDCAFLAAEESTTRICPSHWGPKLAPNTPRVNGQRPERIRFTGGQICGHPLRVAVDKRAAQESVNPKFNIEA